LRATVAGTVVRCFIGAVSLPAESDEPEPGVTAEIAEAGLYPTEPDGFAHGLVVLAMGRSFWLVPADSSFRLLVEAPVLPAVREQLAKYDRESAGWPPRALDEGPAAPPDVLPAVGWALVVLAVFIGQVEAPGKFEASGALDGQALFDHGEWWRPFTALFLHADGAHVLSNVLFGLFAFTAVSTTLGRLRGWTLLLLASVLGNCVSAAVHFPEPYRSLGASTAIFAGLGLLTGRALRRAVNVGERHGWRSVYAPLGSGFVLLGYYGAGGLNVDLSAHVAGFACGLVIGFFASSTDTHPIATSG
jgi:rhomboid protease GluP